MDVLRASLVGPSMCQQNEIECETVQQGLDRFAVRTLTELYKYIPSCPTIGMATSTFVIASRGFGAVRLQCRVWSELASSRLFSSCYDDDSS